jgi:hypothetical protein
MDLADDGVAGNADLGGDLAAGQTGGDAVAQLFDPLRGPRGVSWRRSRPSRWDTRRVGWCGGRGIEHGRAS